MFTYVTEPCTYKSRKQPPFLKGRQLQESDSKSEKKKWKRFYMGRIFTFTLGNLNIFVTIIFFLVFISKSR